MCYLYILKSKRDGKLYIGSTKDLEDRLERHKSGRVKSTRHRLPVELIYKEKYSSLSDARKAEYRYKRFKSRTYILRKIRGHSMSR